MQGSTVGDGAISWFSGLYGYHNSAVCVRYYLNLMEAHSLELHQAIPCWESPGVATAWCAASCQCFSSRQYIGLLKTLVRNFLG